MNTHPVNSELLIHELQLGEKLSQSVHDNRRSDFSLLLALLVDDVREHSQFFLPETQLNTKQVNDLSLRKEFQLGESAPIALKNLADISTFNQVTHIENENLAHIKLIDALQPKALTFRDDKKHITHNVMSNTSLYCQKKRNDNNNIENSQLNFNAKMWLASLDNQIVKAPLLESIA